jgi:hypothetical protein
MLRARHSAGLATDEQLSRATYALKEAEERAPYLLTIRSLGGTLKEFIDVASRSDDVSLNVINAGDPADLEIKLPPFELRNADWGTVIEVLANFLATRGLQLKHAGGGSGGDSAVSRSVVCVLRPIEVIPNMSRSAQPEFEAFQLAPYIIESPRAGDKGQDISVVVDAILAAWSMTGAQINFAQSSALEWSDKQSRMKYHPATKMLFISGPPSAIAVARQVISNLPKNAGYK